MAQPNSQGLPSTTTTQTHVMVTRTQLGIIKPNPHFHCHTSHNSPIPKSLSVTLSYPNWLQRSLYGLKQAPRAWFQRFPVAETAWLRKSLPELHSPFHSATLIYCDNVSVIYLTANLVQHQRTKHIEIDIYCVCDMVAQCHVRVLHVSSRNECVGYALCCLEDWETLAAPFFEVACGSKIIITTRKKELLRKLGHKCPHDLQKLSNNDAFSLFARHAGISDFESHPTLRLHGEGIVKKCDGLPLALKALGSLLRTKTDEEDWKQLLNNEIWTLEDGGGILPALRLSYYDLSAHLKQLFEKDDLILLWMAEGFLHISATNKSMQRLATFVAGEFYSRLDIDVEKNVWQEAFKKYRHMSFACEEFMTYNKFKAFERANSLRTFLAMPIGVGNGWRTFFLSSKVLDDILPQFPLLRVLSLSSLDIDEVPECVGNMKHLRDIREVNLSQKRVSEFCVEWSADFNDARNETLENEVLNALKPHSDNLKDLIIESYGGKLFPNWIGDPSFFLLTCVRIWGCRKCTFLPPLGQLPSLKKLEIRSLNEVKVVGAEFLGTGIAFPKLESLSFAYMSGWEVWSTNSGGVDAVFPRLQTLAIVDCPNLVDVSFEALPSMRVLRLSVCGDGVLISLIHVASAVTKLSIWRISGLSDEVWRGVMDYLGAVEEVSIYFCNEIRYLWESEAKASKVLVNLRKLEVDNCSKLVSLEEKEEEDGCNQLTSLRILTLGNFQNLEHCKLPNKIQELEIDGCEQLLEKELLNPSMLTMLEVVNISRWKILKSINALTCFIHVKILEINDCSSIESFPAADLPNLTSLTHLIILDCKSMDVDSFGLWPPKLGFLEIGGLKKPVSKLGPQNFPSSLVHLRLIGRSAEEDDVSSGSQLSHMLPSSLTELELWNFGKLESVSIGLQHLTSLQHLEIRNCPKIQDLPETLLPSLLTLNIWECPDNLKETISRRGPYWPIVSSIPCMSIH
nr:NB-ARC domains-containing protein [Tanacetum cinerariifolium]